MRTITVTAPFNLRTQNSFFGGWPVLHDTDESFAIVVAFAIENSDQSAAVVIAQSKDGELTAEAHGTSTHNEQAIDQALAALSLDVDDTDWEAVGAHDKVIDSLQKKYDYLRPVLFHSPYEAAAGFVIGQRISIKQRQALQLKMAQAHGATIHIEGNDFFAFPTPQALLQIEEFAGISETKIERLHGIAETALSGKLDRKYLLSLPTQDALQELNSLNGIGPFYASGILYRGAGVVNDITDDDLTRYAVGKAYSLVSEPSQKEVLKIAEQWSPYKMWCEVLVHVWMRREIGMPSRGGWNKKTK